MSHLSEAIQALKIVNNLVGVLPFGSQLGAAVGLAIGLCENIKAVRSYQDAYAEIGSKASSLLCSIVENIHKAAADARAASIPNISPHLASLIRVLEDVSKSAVHNTKRRYKLLNLARQIFLAREEQDVIDGFKRKIGDAVTEFQVLSLMRIEFTMHQILMNSSCSGASSVKFPTPSPVSY